AWGTGAARVRLFVHDRNTRAEAFYRKAGFVASGVTVPGPAGVGGRQLEYVVERRV
ncbi:GNAT family N-acetyltransferase, partial [Streptomyces spongiae]|nr:GNAT family N-acetyltransferase [Streptomyces spongiae]